MNQTSLSIRRIIRAPHPRVFDAWTSPDQLMQWWGPRDVQCTAAQVDLRVGGEYRIANLHSDGRVTWISGVFEIVLPPTELVYSWNIEEAGLPTSRVCVEFRPHADGTELILRHDRLVATVRDMHSQGWNECLDGLEAMLDEVST
jgi:uncharacterized protein YndB with AHSA1/START domain